MNYTYYKVETDYNEKYPVELAQKISRKCTSISEAEEIIHNLLSTLPCIPTGTPRKFNIVKVYVEKEIVKIIEVA